jgi:hypothetical protein
MDISAEKEEIIRKFNLIHDIDLIKAIKSMLDFGLHKQTDDEIALKASIDRAMNESKKGLGRPYEDFMTEVRKRYQA